MADGSNTRSHPEAVEKGAILTLKSTNYLVSASMGSKHRGMRTLHVVIDTGAVINLVCSYMLPFGWRHYLNTQTRLPKTGDANRRPLKALTVLKMLFRLGNAHFRLDFFVIPTLAAPLIISTSFMGQHVKAILCMDGVVQKVRGSIKILGRNKATISAE